MEMAVVYDATDFLAGAREQKKNRAADFVAAKTIEHCALCSSAAQRNKPRTVIDAAENLLEHSRKLQSIGTRPVSRWEAVTRCNKFKNVLWTRIGRFGLGWTLLD